MPRLTSTLGQKALLSLRRSESLSGCQNGIMWEVVFTNPTLSESAFNADSDSVGFVKTTSVFRSFRLTAVCCGRAIERMAWRRTSSLSAPSPPHSAGLSGLCPHLPHFLAAGIAIIRALKAIQCSGFCPGSKNFKDQERGLPVCG